MPITKQIKSLFLRVIFTFLAITSGFSHIKAQSVKLYPVSSRIKVVNAAGDTLRSPWAGGMLSPMFSNIDLNNDGMQDLFVFEPSDSKISTFLNNGGGNFIYAPAYESSFPNLINWAFLVDYNKDNKADIFAYSHEGGGIEVYKNESSGSTVKFRKITGMLRYPPQNINIYASPIDIPSITDVDGDGDVDILALDVFQSNVTFYNNRSIETYGNADSLYYDIWDFCWGKFQEPGNSNIPSLFAGCGPPPHKKAAHGGFSLLALDLDGDGDKDLLQGDLTSNTLIMLKNGRINNGQQQHPVDSMIALDSLFLSGTHRPNVAAFLSAYYVDIDNDNKRDLLISPLDAQTNLNQVLLYKNKGSDNNPVFEFVQNNFLQDQMIDLGLHTAPAFFDYNGDGLKDMVVATLGDFRQTRHLYERLVLYKNIGTAANPVFRKENDDYLGLSAQELSGLAAAFGDMDNDGKTDMLLGTSDGTLMFFKNNAAAGQDADLVLQNANFAGIDVGLQSTPAIADIDRDGLPDLIIGERNGNINYYRNTGTSFTLVTDSLGKIKTNTPYYDYIYDNNGNIIDSVLKYEREGFSAPAVADMDGDGKWDLVSGAINGYIYFYSNIEDNPSAAKNRSLQLLFNTSKNAYENKNMGRVSMPAIADLDNDSIPDLLIGNDRGGMYLYSGKSETIILSLAQHQFQQQSGFKVFPNPAKEQLHILPLNLNDKDITSEIKLQVINIIGQEVLSKTINNFSAEEVINTSVLRAGIYILSIKSATGMILQNEKIIIK